MRFNELLALVAQYAVRVVYPAGEPSPTQSIARLRLEEFCGEITALRQQLAAERQKRCGTCADWKFAVEGHMTHKGYGLCANPQSECAMHGVAIGDHVILWSADHGCPSWRGKEAK